MVDKLVGRLEKAGKLRKQRAGFVQIEALLKEAILDLEEAHTIAHLAERATYLLAYNAMLKAGRALMLMHGFVPAGGGQHKTVVEMTSAVLGDHYRTLTDHFETMRRKRNVMTYEAGTLLSKSEAQRAFADAITLLEKILDETKARNPQLELKLDLKGK